MQFPFLFDVWCMGKLCHQLQVLGGDGQSRHSLVRLLPVTATATAIAGAGRETLRSGGMLTRQSGISHGGRLGLVCVLCS